MSLPILSRAAVACLAVTLGAWPALAAPDAAPPSDAYLVSMCTDMAGWTPKQLEKFPDPQVERAVCLSAKANFRAITTRNKAAERQCTAAARNLLAEFTRRWPERDAGEVAGKC